MVDLEFAQLWTSVSKLIAFGNEFSSKPMSCLYSGGRLGNARCKEYMMMMMLLEGQQTCFVPGAIAATSSWGGLHGLVGQDFLLVHKRLHISKWYAVT